MDLRRTVRRVVDPDLRDDLAAAVVPWLVSRALVGVAFVVARLVADELDAAPVPLADGLFAWDGVWYRGIAEFGYGGLPDDAVRFFPLYPIAGRVVGFVLAGREWLALLLLANLGALVAAVIVHRLTLNLTGDRQTALRATWLLLLSPASFVLVWAYSEAMFLVASAGALLALRRRAWSWAAGVGAAAALTRPVGVLLVVAAVVEALGSGRGGRRVARAAAVLGPLVGLAAFLVWAEVSGRWQAPIDAQTPLRGDLAVPLVPLFTGLADVVDGRLSAGLHLGAAAVFAGLVVVAFLRLPLAFGLLAAAMFLVATSAERLTSVERYALGAVPIIIAAAIVVRRPAVERAVLPLTASAMVGLAVLAWLGAYTP
ncbi:MAG: mannosyltransferase family protein [Acidimicrobiales bacterium]